MPNSKNWDLDLSDEGFWDSLLGRVCNRERAVLRQTSSQDFFSEKGRSETDPLGRVISESCLRSLEPRARSQKMLSRILPRILLRIFPEFFEDFSCFVSWETETRNNSPKIPTIFQCKIPRQIRKIYSQNFSGEQAK